MIIESWKQFIEEEMLQPYFINIRNFLHEQIVSGHIYFPPKNRIFQAMQLTSLKNVRVVILGQDPYPGDNQANGLAFSVNKNILLPKSLHNIFSEIASDLSCEAPTCGDLTFWAKQGVLLLNSVLTVSKNSPGSHFAIGWQNFTSKCIKILNESTNPIIFLLWGATAQSIALPILTNKIHIILKAAHPSPLSAHKGFFGCKHFSTTNVILSKLDMDIIQWVAK
jgi:uracil-DNA glycosylase